MIRQRMEDDCQVKGMRLLALMEQSIIDYASFAGLGDVGPAKLVMETQALPSWSQKSRPCQELEIQG